MFKKSKNLFFISLFCAISTFSFSQHFLSNLTKQDLNDIHSKWKISKTKFEKELTTKYPIYKIENQYYLSLFAVVETNFQTQQLVNLNAKIGSFRNYIISFKLPVEKINELAYLVGVIELEIPGKIKPMLDRAVKDVKADSVHLGINLPQAYTGKNVYIGVTDWGFDYTHPNFYDTSMLENRIAAAWDQYKQLGDRPNGFSYGVEYNTTSELLTAQSDTANIYSYAYHGSHVAGIAGGGGANTQFRGVAFDAQFLFTTFLIDAASVIDAYEWMYQKAQADGKRLVINQSWGLHHMGNLDGTSILSQAIDNYSALGVTFVSSGGNNGDVNFHIKKTFNNDFFKTKVDFYSYAANANMWGQSISLWGEENKHFQVSFEVINSLNQVLNATPNYHTLTTVNYVDSFLLVGTSDTVYFNLAPEAANMHNNRPHIRLRINNRNTSYRIILKVEAIDGTVHLWNVTELTTDVGNWGMPFALFGANSLAGNTQYGISEPACTNSTIAVAAYSPSYYFNNALTGGSIASFSSYGPTMDERVKPDISAPGVSIASSFSSFTDASFTSVANVDFQGRSYPFARISGTSMSAPMVTGVVALLLEANPNLTPAEIKQFIIDNARTDNYTGVIPDTGSVRWGFGKINAYQTIFDVLEINTIENLGGDEIMIYPNPTNAILHLKLSKEIGDFEIQLIDVLGKNVFEGKNLKTLDFSNLNSGIYILKIATYKQVFSKQIVKN